MSQIRVKDYTGKVIHKKKRGFATKKEALEWERDFLNKATADMGMLFQDFVELYFPPCVFYTVTHFYCPGCGNTRTVLALLHGHPLQALHNNAAFCYLLVVLVLRLVVFCWVRFVVFWVLSLVRLVELLV